jgi:hypothetical protein
MDLSIEGVAKWCARRPRCISSRAVDSTRPRAADSHPAQPPPRNDARGRARAALVADMGPRMQVDYLRAFAARAAGAGATDLLRVLHARVPIVKFRVRGRGSEPSLNTAGTHGPRRGPKPSRPTDRSPPAPRPATVDNWPQEPWSGRRLDCDVAIGSPGGMFKSAALGLLAQVDPRFGALVRLVKGWAKRQGVNDPSQGTLNSYCLTLVIFHLQCRAPAILPPLCELFADDAALEAYGGDGSATGAGGATTEPRPLAGGAPGDPALLARAAGRLAARAAPRAANTETLAELLASFFALYEGVAGAWAGGDTKGQDARGAAAGTRALRRARVDTWAGALRGGRWEGSLDEVYIFSVEDPFDSADNCARTVRRPAAAAAVRAALAAGAAACALEAGGGATRGAAAGRLGALRRSVLPAAAEAREPLAAEVDALEKALAAGPAGPAARALPLPAPPPPRFPRALAPSLAGALARPADVGHAAPRGAAAAEAAALTAAPDALAAALAGEAPPEGAPAWVRALAEGVASEGAELGALEAARAVAAEARRRARAAERDAKRVAQRAAQEATRAAAILAAAAAAEDGGPAAAAPCAPRAPDALFPSLSAPPGLALPLLPLPLASPPMPLASPPMPLAAPPLPLHGLGEALATLAVDAGADGGADGGADSGAPPPRRVVRARRRGGKAGAPREQPATAGA